ncbi:MAG: GDP-mannose 4,6-dehydratase [Candidatus Kerfeldbacteria bacterium]|nr:GDP-mannose 4,6-dehydratase [Candidatus Kerfeldbacteria bacterium]
MATVLVTGIGGFVGPFLESELRAHGYQVIGLERRPSTSPHIHQADITDPEQVGEIVSSTAPDAIIHLAGFSSVAKSWADRELVKKINVDGTENLLRAAMKLPAQPRVVIISSAEAYGPPAKVPIDEAPPLKATSPYGQSRVAQERLSLDIYGEVVISRSFNHTGPGQPPIFSVPSFIQQALLTAAGKQSKVKVGNLDAIRDFSDVRDVVRAYRLLMERGRPQQVYNVCSGIGRPMRDILARILQLTGLDAADVEIDPERLHPSDIPALIGDNTKLKLETDWRQTFDFLDKTLPDSVKYAQTHAVST